MLTIQSSSSPVESSLDIWSTLVKKGINRIDSRARELNNRLTGGCSTTLRGCAPDNKKGRTILIIWRIVDSLFSSWPGEIVVRKKRVLVWLERGGDQQQQQLQGKSRQRNWTGISPRMRHFTQFWKTFRIRSGLNRRAGWGENLSPVRVSLYLFLFISVHVGRRKHSVTEGVNRIGRVWEKLGTTESRRPSWAWVCHADDLISTHTHRANRKGTRKVLLHASPPEKDDEKK